MTMKNNSYLRIFCTIGLILSIYVTYVELQAEHDSRYRAFCDIGPAISCTKVFASPYGRGFGLLQSLFGSNFLWIPPNGIIGIVFYLFLITTSHRYERWLSLVRVAVCFLANLLSIHLAYLLYFVLENLCIVCVFIYAVNYLCLVQTWRMHNQLHKLKKH